MPVNPGSAPFTIRGLVGWLAVLNTVTNHLGPLTLLDAHTGNSPVATLHALRRRQSIRSWRTQVQSVQSVRELKSSFLHCFRYELALSNRPDNSQWELSRVGTLGDEKPFSRAYFSVSHFVTIQIPQGEGLLF